MTKLAAEHLAVLYHRNFGLDTTSLRFFTVYGPRQRPDMAFHRFLRAARDGEAVSVFGDGLQTRDFTYVDDIVAALRAAALSGRPGSVYNVGGGERVALNDVLRMIEDVTGRPLRVQRQEAQKGDMRDTFADTTAAARDLGFRSSVSLREGLAREWAWLLEQSVSRLSTSIPALAVMALLAAACGSKTVDMTILSSPNDGIVWDAGDKAFKRQDWAAARQYFKRIVDAFPQSEHQPDARIAVADSYFEEGGTANYVLAASAYHEFLTLYPQHPRSDYAQFRAAESYFKQHNSPDRDQTQTKKALEEYEKLLDIYPESKLVEETRGRIRECRQIMARAHFLVGYFYQRGRQAWRSAIGRYETIINEYPDYDQSRRGAVPLRRVPRRLGPLRRSAAPAGPAGAGVPEEPIRRKRQQAARELPAGVHTGDAGRAGPGPCTGRPGHSTPGAARGPTTLALTSSFTFSVREKEA